MGLADMLIKLGIKYGSKESIVYIDRIFNTIAEQAVLTSLEMAKLYECYPKCEKEKLKDSAFIKNLNFSQEVLDDLDKYGLYNSQLLTCPPTGSTATMIEVSTGVEPNFALKYTRKTESLNGKDEYYEVNAKIVEDYRNISGNIEELPDYFITSESIDPIQRIKVQAIMQKYIDASISSTINLPETATVEDVYNIYLEAWKHHLKGCTIYRANCNRTGILTTKETKEEEPNNSLELKRGEVIKAGNDCIGLKRDLMTGCGSLHCQAFFDPINGELREMYLSKGSTGGCNQFMISLSRMISLSARGGISIDKILDQLKSCGVCPSYAVRSATKKDTSKGSCCPVAVGKALKEMYDEIQDRLKDKDSNVEKVPTIAVSIASKIEYEECPNCHEKTLVHAGGCVQCTNCCYSKCD